MKIFSDYKESPISCCQRAIAASWIALGPSTQTTEVHPLEGPISFTPEAERLVTFSNRAVRNGLRLLESAWSGSYFVLSAPMSVTCVPLACTGLRPGLGPHVCRHLMSLFWRTSQITRTYEPF